MTRPRGMPPTPSARSRAMLPVGVVAMARLGLPSPKRMMAPVPNCLSGDQTGVGGPETTALLGRCAGAHGPHDAVEALRRWQRQAGAHALALECSIHV